VKFQAIRDRLESLSYDARLSRSFALPNDTTTSHPKETTMLRTISLTTLCLVLFATTARAAEGPQPAALFDGKTLDEWKVMTCDIEVQDGAIFIKDGNGILLADKEYGDFILECDWKALNLEMWDSGIYFRCGLPPQGRPWPVRHQVNMRKSMEGMIAGGQKVTDKNLFKPGEWNHFKLTVKGKTAVLELNGEKAYVHENIEPAKGHLCLQAEVPGGGQFLFKNVTIVDLDQE